MFNSIHQLIRWVCHDLNRVSLHSRDNAAVCVCQLKIQCEDAMLHNSLKKWGLPTSAPTIKYTVICVNAIMSSIKQYEDAYASKDAF